MRSMPVCQAPGRDPAECGPGRVAGAGLLYGAAVAFLLLRTPFEAIHGAVLGEEGTVYLRYAWDAPPLRALIAPHQGYYSLLPNVCGLLAARVFPLEAAGQLCVFAELAVHMLLAYTLVQCERFVGLRQKAVAVAVGLLTVPTAAIVLCTDNAQFFLAIVAGVILISDAERLRWSRLAALGFAGLNGVLSCVLLPLFVLRVWQERAEARRAKARAAQAVVLVGCCVVQFWAILAGGGGSLHVQVKARLFAAAFLINGPLPQFFSHWSAAEACKAIGSPKLAGHQTAMWLGIEGAAGLYLLGVFALAAAGGRAAARLLAMGALVGLGLAVVRGGNMGADLICGSGARYFFTFNLFLGLALVLVAAGAKDWKGRVAGVLVACSLVSGVLDVWYLLGLPHGPVWRTEVSLWRADPDHRLRIGPGGWPGIRLTVGHADAKLPFAVYDSTQPGWRER